MINQKLNKNMEQIQICGKSFYTNRANPCRFILVIMNLILAFWQKFYSFTMYGSQYVII